jgi:hypothetical protein
MDAKFWRAGMPSLKQKQRLNHYICLGLSTLLLSSTLVGCGSGESEAPLPTETPTTPTPSPRTLNVKVPVEMRNITIKVYDNTENTLILEQKANTTTNLVLTLPQNIQNRIYRVELTTQPTALIYNPLSSQYDNVSTTLNALIEFNLNSTSKNVFINPNSEAIYQRALIRSGYLPSDTKIDPTGISSLHLKLASNDVNTALLSAFNSIDLPNLSPAYSLSSFTIQDVADFPALYTSIFFSFGYIQQWANTFPNDFFNEFTKNLAVDLRDGQLDAKKVRGDKTTLRTLITTAPENVDPAQNTLLKIAANQKTIRDQYGASLKEATLELAKSYQQDSINLPGYNLLQQKVYAFDPQIESNDSFRVSGAGDYRRAVGFVDTTATCNGSTYPCKQGLTGINLVNVNLPSIEYLIGHYDDGNGCQLNVRANGVLELTKGSQNYRSTLDADSTDNLLQVDKTTHEYILNSSSSQPTNPTFQYNFIQIRIKANQVISASAGLDNRKAPDQLQSTQLQCSF